ncbi:MAG: O-methyltransferase [Vicinamibacterales bacterium]|nr:O-methyltransferase [Vicinamibacterales bacterium]
MDQRWAAVDEYLTSLFASDQEPEAALHASRDAKLPDISVTPPQGKLLHLLARAHNARSILEIGTLGGYSTIWLAKALQPGGRLVTLESDAVHAQIARANLDRAVVGDVVDIRLGPAQETLPTLTGPFDMIFIDADKQSYPTYLHWALRLSRRGTLIIADNVVRDGGIVDPDNRDPKVQGARQFLDLLADEPRVSATVVQTVGSKGYDGFALALVIAD